MKALKWIMVLFFALWVVIGGTSLWVRHTVGAIRRDLQASAEELFGKLTIEYEGEEYRVLPTVTKAVGPFAGRMIPYYSTDSRQGYDARPVYLRLRLEGEPFAPWNGTTWDFSFPYYYNSGTKRWQLPFRDRDWEGGRPAQGGWLCELFDRAASGVVSSHYPYVNYTPSEIAVTRPFSSVAPELRGMEIVYTYSDRLRVTGRVEIKGFYLDGTASGADLRILLRITEETLEGFPGRE